MAIKDPSALLRKLLQEEAEREWLEFKRNNWNPDMVGRSVSAVANSAMLAGRDRAFLVWGIEDTTKKKVGTTIKLGSLRKGNEPFHNWLSHMIDPAILMEPVDFRERGMAFAILALEPSYERPVKFSGEAYIRIGQSVKPLTKFPNLERSLWFATSRHRFESAIAAPHQSVNEVLSKLDVNAYYRISKERRSRDPIEVIRRFVMLEFIKDDSEGGYDITNVGALLLANDLTQFPSLSTKSTRIVKYADTDKANSSFPKDMQLNFSGYCRRSRARSLSKRGIATDSGLWNHFTRR